MRVSRSLPGYRQHALLRIFRINFSNLSNFDQTAICLLDMLPLTLAVCLRPE
jgi:hypothetical protein